MPTDTVYSSLAWDVTQSFEWSIMNRSV